MLSRVATAVVAVVGVAASVVVLQSNGSAASPELSQNAEPETKAGVQATAASLSGKWTITVDTPVGKRPFWIEMKVDPKDSKRVTGTISTLVSKDLIEGEVADGKLTFWFSSTDPGGNMVRVTFVGTVQKDGSLAGTLTFGQGSPMPWTAVRDEK